MSALPSHIGAYEVVRLLGKGGMAIVYLGRDPAIDRLVAIKLLRESLDSVELRERFSREAKSAGRLRHPNIVTVFQVGVHDNAPFIVMEYIPGESLAEVIRRQPPVTLTWKLRVIEDLCRGLAYAHKSGVVHRDMKPANIQIDSDGGVKILDFGIARLGEQKAGEEALTRLGMMMGTPNYMAPEQINPGTADHRSDVFAVGLVFYELLTYHRAFGGDSYAVLHNILHQEPDPVDRHCPDIDPDIIAIVNRALNKNPNARYQDLADMRDDIRRVRLRLRTTSDDVSDEGPITAGGHAHADTEVTRLTDRRTEITRFLDEARAAYEANDFHKAVERCHQALKLDPEFTEAIELATRASDQLALAQARDLIAAGQEAYAAGNLEAAANHVRDAEALQLPAEGGSTVQSQLSALARAVASATERQKALRERLERGRELLTSGALDQAARVVDEAVGLSPGNRDALALRAEVRAAIDAERARQRAAEDAVADARQQAEDGHFDAAIALLQRHRPEHPLVTAAVGDIQALKAEAEQRAADERRRQEHAAAARATLAAARQAADQGDLAGALQQVASIAFRDQSLASPALDRIRIEVDAFAARCEAGQHLEAARAALAANDLTVAASSLDQARHRDPSHPDNAGMATAIDRARAIRDRVGRARAELQRGDLESAERLVGEALTQAPDHRDALQLRDSIRAAIAEREAALERAADDVVAAARRDAQRGKFAKAISVLKEHRPAHPKVTATLADIVDQQAAAERRAADERRRQEHASRARAAIRAASAAADQGDPSAALMLLQGIEFDAPEISSPALDALKAEAEALIARCEAAKYLEAARAALAANDLTVAATSLDQARHRDPSHPDNAGMATAIDRARAVRDRLGRARAELQRGDLESAERLVGEALAQAPDHREALQLRDSVRTAVAEREAALERAAGDVVAAARRDAQRGEFAKAISVLKDHRPAHPKVTATLADIIDQQAAAERRAADERRRQEHASRARAAIRAARAAADQGDPSAALMLLQGIEFDAPEISSPALSALKAEAEALIARCEAAGYLDMARAELAKGNRDAATEALDLARQRDAGHPDLDEVAAALSAETVSVEPPPATIVAAPPEATVYLPRPAMAPPPGEAAPPAAGSDEFPPTLVQPAEVAADRTVVLRPSPVSTPSPVTTRGPEPVPIADPPLPTAKTSPARARPTAPAKGAATVAQDAQKRTTGMPLILGGVAAAILAIFAIWWFASRPANEPASVVAGNTTPAVAEPVPATTPQTAPSAPASEPEGPSGVPPTTATTPTPTPVRPAPSSAAPPSNAGRGSGANPVPARGASTPGGRAGAGAPVPTPLPTPGRSATPATPANPQPAGPLVTNIPAPAPPQAPPEREPAPTPPPSQTPRAPEPQVERPAAPAAPDTAREEAAIRSVLGQYVAGYQRLDPAAIRAVWPSAPGDLQKSFNDLRSYELQLQNQQITVRGDTATVSATRRIRQQPKAGRVQEGSVPSTFILRRTGGSWLIESIR